MSICKKNLIKLKKEPSFHVFEIIPGVSINEDLLNAYVSSVFTDNEPSNFLDYIRKFEDEDFRWLGYRFSSIHEDYINELSEFVTTDISDLLEWAVNKSDIYYVRYAVANCSLLNSDLMCKAAENGDIDIMMLLHDSGCELGDQLSIYASSGSLECLIYAYNNGCNLIKRAIYFAAEAGKIDCLMFLHEKITDPNKRDYEDDEDPILVAVSNGHFDCVIFLVNEGYHMRDSLIDIAIKKNYPDILNFLHKSGCLIDFIDFGTAATYGSLECLKFLHENGCPWDENVTCMAACRGNLTCLKFLHENGYPWNFRTFKEAILYGKNNKQCIKYLYENGCPSSLEDRLFVQKQYYCNCRLNVLNSFNSLK